MVRYLIASVLAEEIVMKSEKTQALSAKDLAEFLGIGRDKAYALMRSKSFPSILLGKRYIVLKEALERWLRDKEGKNHSL